MVNDKLGTLLSGWERPGLGLFLLLEMGVLVKVGVLGAGILRSSLGKQMVSSC